MADHWSSKYPLEPHLWTREKQILVLDETGQDWRALISKNGCIGQSNLLALASDAIPERDGLISGRSQPLHVPQTC